MAFDINGVWANSTGPNAPFDYQHNRGLQLSYTQAIDQWLAAKWPADKLVAGVPFYGRSLTTREVIVAKDGADMYVPFANEVPQGDLDDALWYDVCENVNSMSGIWNYRHLRDQGLLRTANTTTDDWIRIWDHTSSTPWLYNPQLRRFITYDDQESLAKKVDYARNKGIKGMMVWALNGDYQNELISTLEAIGPLCRGPKTANDTEPDHQSSSAAAASSASPASTSSVPPASIGSASPAPASPEASSHSGPWTMPSLFSTGGSTSQQPSNNASEQSTSSPSVESHSENSSSAESPATTSEVSKAIMFDSVGVPYAIISGKSTAVPSDMADVLMKLGVESSSQTSASAATSAGESPVASMPSASVESGSAAQSSSISAESAESSPGSAAAAESAGSSTALSASSSAQPESTPNDTTGTSAELLAATSSISFPVPDSSDSTSPAGVQRGPMPRRPGWKSEINLFETMLPGGIMGGSGTGLPHPMSDRTSGSGTISGNSGTVSSNGSSAESSSASAASSQTSPAPSS
ncbi:hypothetical protein EC988_004369 [Linderina pennispora]|nr:hypothetical protein EC988_004369 [Linderina pennispora]